MPSECWQVPKLALLCDNKRKKQTSQKTGTQSRGPKSVRQHRYGSRLPKIICGVILVPYLKHSANGCFTFLSRLWGKHMNWKAFRRILHKRIEYKNIDKLRWGDQRSLSIGSTKIDENTWNIAKGNEAGQNVGEEEEHNEKEQKTDVHYHSNYACTACAANNCAWTNNYGRHRLWIGRYAQSYEQNWKENQAVRHRQLLLN